MYRVKVFIVFNSSVTGLLMDDGAFESEITDNVEILKENGVEVRAVKRCKYIYYQYNDNPINARLKDVVFFGKTRAGQLKTETVRLPWMILPSVDEDSFENRVIGFADLIRNIFGGDFGIAMGPSKFAEVVRKFMHGRMLHRSSTFTGLSFFINHDTVDPTRYLALVNQLLPCIYGSNSEPNVTPYPGSSTEFITLLEPIANGKSYRWIFNKGSISILNVCLVGVLRGMPPRPMPFIKPWSAFLPKEPKYDIMFHGGLYFSTSDTRIEPLTPVTRMICNGSIQLKERVDDMIFNVPTNGINAKEIQDALALIISYIGAPDDLIKQRRICAILHGVVMSKLMQYVSRIASRGDPFVMIADPYVCSFMFNSKWLIQTTTIVDFLNALSKCLLAPDVEDVVQDGSCQNIYQITNFGRRTVYWNVSGSSCELVVNPINSGRIGSTARTESMKSTGSDLADVEVAEELDETARALSEGHIMRIGDNVVFEDGVLLGAVPQVLGEFADSEDTDLATTRSLQSKFSLHQTACNFSSTATKNLNLLLSKLDRVLQHM